MKASRLFILSLLVLSVFAIPLSSAALTDYLIYYHDFNNATDKASNSLDLTAFQGSPTFQTSGALLGFAGLISVNNNWFLNTGLTEAVDFPSTKNNTLNFWFNQTVTTDSITFFYADGTGTDFFIKYLNGTVNNISIEGFGRTITISNITISKWNMMTLVANSTNVTIYFNGVKIDSPHYDTARSNIGFYLGADSAGNGDWTGMMDELGYWNRTLTDAEISQLYNSGGGTSPFFVVTVNQNVFNLSVYETATETFFANVTLDSGTLSSANLNYNSVSYPGTISTSGIHYLITASIDIPVFFSSGNQSFSWTLTNNNGTDYTIPANHFVNETTIFGQCNATLNESVYLNFTFTNETTAQENITAFVPSSFFNYYLGTGNTSKNLSFSTAIENFSFLFCFTPNYKTLNLDYEMDYDNSYSQQRSIAEDNVILTNATTHKTLFLLPDTDGIFTTFQIINLAQQPVVGATVTLTRSGFGTVLTGTTSAAGTVTFFLDPDVTYTLTVEGDGFETFTITQPFPLSEYTITIGGTGIVTDDLTKGISALVKPSPQTLTNNTVYQFNLTLSSSYWSLDSFGFIVFNNTSVITSTSSTSSSGGFLSVNVNTTSNDILGLRYYWVINGTYSNATLYYDVYSGGSGSIKGFFDRLDSYVDTGFFGLTRFGLNLIIFITIFSIVGVLAFKYGLNSPDSLVGVTFFLVLLFDVGLGLLPNPAILNQPPQHILTILAFLIWILVLMREAFQ